MDKERAVHSLAVANKMVEIGKKYNLSDNEIEELFILGFNHDIGYKFSNNTFEHNIVGGCLLKNNGYKYWKEVYYHGDPNADYKSLYLTILSMADMQIDKYGNDVGYKKRLEDIKVRYGEYSREYKNAFDLILELKRERSVDYNG